jgi:hypothetical protein
MIIRVFNRGGYMIIERDGCEVDMLATVFDWNFTPPNTNLLNTSLGGTITVVTTEIRDVDFNLVGNQAQVDAYLTTEKAKQIDTEDSEIIEILEQISNSNNTISEQILEISLKQDDLNKIKELQKITNKLLNKIYK